MKIGIITIHKSEVNYGACLQCYALWRYISNLGHNCEIIDLKRPSQKGYRYPLNYQGMKTYLILGLKLSISKLYALIRDRKIKARIDRYKNFNSIINYSDAYHSPKEIMKNPPSYDIYISGSDQIWNPNMAFDNRPYLLSFVPKGKKKVAYASSFGTDWVPSEFIETYRYYLKQYDYLSTRENGGKMLIKELTGADVPVVSDPVFLLSAQEWEQITDNQYGLKEDYVFVYSLHKNNSLLSYARKIAEKKNYKVVLVNANYNVCKMPDVLQFRDAGPKQWLNLVKNANLFLTDSFHGTAFAIIFETPFLVQVRKSAGTNDRIFTLLSCLGLLDNVLSTDVNLEEITVRAFTHNYKTLLQNEIARSKKYLTDLL